MASRIRCGGPQECQERDRLCEQLVLKTLTIDLPSAVYERLRTIAEQQQTSVETIAQEWLTEKSEAMPGSTGRERLRAVLRAAGKLAELSPEEKQRAATSTLCALDAPWEKWTVFLHPEQRQIVERTYSGPARVSGSAGTGKTIVALHRAVFLARANPDARILLTTFSDTLANALRAKLRYLVSEEHKPKLAERIEVYAIQRKRTLLRRRSGPAHLSAALLVEGVGGRCAWALAHLACELPHLAPDSHAGRPPAGRPGLRPGWEQRPAGPGRTPCALTPAWRGCVAPPAPAGYT
jgi:UvrD/REP helicase N-terminal domain